MQDNMRKLILIMAFVTACLATSCEKNVTEEYSMPEMKAFYQESLTLPSVSSDSVGRFARRFDNFIDETPEAYDDPLYPKIIENIKTVSLNITITCDTAWAGTTYIHY